MAAYTQDTFTIYNEEFQTGLWQRTAQNILLFNGHSAGAVRLASDMVTGDYVKNTFFDPLSESAITRRNKSSIASVASIDITQSEDISVNRAERIGPIDKTLSAWAEISEDAGEMSVLVGQMIGDLKSKVLVNKALMCLKAALSNQTALTYDVTSESASTLSLAYLNKGLAKMGDRAGDVVAWVMHSKPYFDLVGGQITDKMDSVAGVVVYGGTPASMGRPVVVTDSTSLLTDNASVDDYYYTLGLTANACVITDSNQSRIVSDVVTGLDNLVGRIQGEYDINIALKGFAWDVTNGGANPTDATLAIGTNWDKVVSSAKDCGGVVIKTT